jgi:hypothetical protein
MQLQGCKTIFMPKPKVILLPATDELLDLYKGKVKWRTKQRYKIFAWIDFLKDRITITELIFYWGFVVRIFSLLIALLIVIPHLIIGNSIKLLFGKEKGDKWFELVKDFFYKIFQEKHYDISNQVHFTRANRKISEDVPNFLTESRRHGFENIVYIKPNEKHLIPKIESLIQQGWISKYIVYHEFKELGAYIENKELNIQNSWVIYDLPEKKFIPKNIIDEEWTNQLYLSKNIEFHFSSRKFGQSFNECGKKIMFSRVKLNYYNLFQPDVVLYFEKDYNPAVNACIQNRLEDLRAKFASKKMKLVYFPSLNNMEEPPESFMDMLMYSQPDLFSGDEALNPKQIFSWLSNIKVKELYSLLGEMLDIPNQPEACFIRCLHCISEDADPQMGLYTLYPIYGTDEEKVSQEIDFYLSVLQHTTSSIHFSLKGEDPSIANADKWFFTEGQKISDEIKAKIAEIKQFTAEETILETLFYMIKEFREEKPELCRQLCLQLYDEMDSVSRKTSRLFIDKHFRIFLPDYNNIEIELTPLPKTLYLFLLKYPDGVFFKELYMHKKELLDIYGRIGNRTDLEQMQKSINDMTDARSNSVNEKCSRIKEAFLSKLDQRLALQYIVTGNRQDAKCISLDRSLVVFEEQI